MATRFRKSMSIAPGVSLNFGKKSASISVGPMGLKQTISTTGRHSTTVSIPGTGISHTTSHSIGGNTKRIGSTHSGDEQSQVGDIPYVESSPRTIEIKLQGDKQSMVLRNDYLILVKHTTLFSKLKKQKVSFSEISKVFLFKSTSSRGKIVISLNDGSAFTVETNPQNEQAASEIKRYIDSFLQTPPGRMD